MSFLEGIKKRALEAEIRLLAKSSLELVLADYGLKVTLTATDVDKLVMKVLAIYEAKTK